jgi:hypothetical protein
MTHESISLLAIPLPPLFHEIILKLLMHIRVTNVMADFKKALNAISISLVNPVGPSS